MQFKKGMMMSKSVFIQILILIFPLLVFAENTDSVRLETISVNGIELYTPAEKLILHLGKPSRKTRSDDEIESGSAYNFYYGDDIYFISSNQKVIGFEIANPKSFIKFGNRKLSPKTSCTLLKKYFPNSYSIFLKNDTFRIRVEGSDTFIVFNIKHGIIESIESWVDD